MREPIVSVVTPSYNQGDFIGDTIESVRRQRKSYANVEHIIMDGESQDNTTEILRRQNDIIWFSEKDKGQSDAINKGWKLCKGEILAYINSDDLYADGAFKRVTEYFDTHPSVAAVYGLCAMIDTKGTTLSIWNPPEFKIKSYIRCGISYIPQPTLFFRKSVLQEIGFLDVSLQHTMDYDFIIRIGRHGQIRRLPCVLASFRIHPDSKTSTGNRTQRLESHLVREKYLDEPYLLSLVGLCLHKCGRVLSWPSGGPHPLLSRLMFALRSSRFK